MKRCRNCFCEYQDKYTICPTCGFEENEQQERLYYLPLGAILNKRYCVGEVLGVGGFGIIYRALDMKYNLVRSIKEYFPSGLCKRTPGAKNVITFTGKRAIEFELGLNRFLLEARNEARFHSDNIREVYDYFQENQTGYMVMEYLDGKTLSDYVKQQGGRLPWREVVSYGVQVCNALTLLHENEVIHRDISPDNVFRCKGGHIKIIDFGAAKFGKQEDYARAVILKPGFAPPEQYESVTEQGPWTDIYGLGATLYFLLTGIRPEESVNRVIKDDLVYPKELVEDIPTSISNAVMKAMAVDVSMRFQEAADFGDAIIRKKAIRKVETERLIERTLKGATIVGAFGVLVVAGVVCWSIWRKGENKKVLGDIELVVWYIQPEDSEVAQERETAMNQLVSEFQTVYPTVDIRLQSFFEDSYSEVLERAYQAGTMPDLFESTGIEEEFLDESAASLEDTVKEIEQQGVVLFESEIETLSSERHGIPTAFSIPVLYKNVNLVSDSLERATSFSDLINGRVDSASEMDICTVDSEETDFFETMFQIGEEQEGVLYSDEALNQFLSKNSCYSFLKVEDYATIRAEMSGQYSVVEVDTEQLMGTFCEYWSISADSGEGEQSGAAKFLTYMFSDYAQDILFVQNSSGRPLPLSENALEQYVYTYEELESVLSDIEKYNIQ